MRNQTKWIAVSLICLSVLMTLAVGCEESIRQTVIVGLEEGTTTILASLIAALFQGLASETGATAALAHPGFIGTLAVCL